VFVAVVDVIRCISAVRLTGTSTTCWDGVGY
jgi:hypothetical protein